MNRRSFHPAAFAFAALSASPWARADDYMKLSNNEGQSIEVKILHAGEHQVYLRRGLKPPQRVALSVFDAPSRERIHAWRAARNPEPGPDELAQIIELAREVTPDDLPLLIDPDPAKEWTFDERFSDEFNGRRLDERKWERDMAPWGDRAWRPENVEQKNGKLLIHAKYDRHKDRRGNQYFYTVGILRSRKTATYGYFEARIKGCSRYPGLCPAFWLYSSGGRNPDFPHITYSEIDIVELQQGNFSKGRGDAGPQHIDLNLHTREMIDGKETWRRPQHWPEVCKNDYTAPWDPRDDFHVYACENTPEKITWFIDGLKVAESPNHNWHLPMYVTLTMELRPPFIAWAGEDGRQPVPENSVTTGFPTHMEVDYVRCWILKA